MTNLLDHAKAEFEKLGWPGDCEMQKAVCDDILALLEVFSAQDHSGSSALYVINLFNKLARFDPISPLTGEDDEWHDPYGGEPTMRNKRCSEVYKNRHTGESYWAYGKIFRDKNGVCFTSHNSKVSVDFPWIKPEPEIIDVKD